jgi:Mg-chelatase subunit ChlD
MDDVTAKSFIFSVQSKSMNFKQFISIGGIILTLNLAGVFAVRAKCSDSNSPLTALLKIEDDGKKIPLILIHGIHGAGHDKNVDEPNDYWNVFRASFNDDTELKQKYSLYIFQYCSDRQPVFPNISNELGKAIENSLNGRPHVILAHSMGGLVAKSYMVFYKFKTGKLGGDAVLGLITLATPHHGTPGANHFDTLKPYTKFGWENKVQCGLKIYWGGSFGKCASLQFLNSGDANLTWDSSLPNRSDLRWDNFDKSFDKEQKNNDDNIWLVNANTLFEKYKSNIIVYGGFLKSDAGITANVISGKLNNGYFGNDDKLKITNELLYQGFNGRFGLSDGLVPYKSALFCTNQSIISKPNSNSFCQSMAFKVRRFEPGKTGEVEKENSPVETRIFRNEERGYDHENMRDNWDVLQMVAEDLRMFFTPQPQPVESLPPVIIPTAPTLFLFDVSGSMAENGKIEQARAAGLDALREIRTNSNSSPSPVSILTFSGNNCGGNVTQNLLGFTTNLAQAETVMNYRIPKPDGGTPLPQALQTSINTLTDYLNSNQAVKDGRIVVLSDGQSTCGEIRPAGTYSRRTDIGITSDGRIKFLTVGFDVPPGSPAERDLQYLADLTGGKYFNAADRRQLIRAFQKLVRVFVPKSSRYGSNPDFANGIKAFQRFDYLAAWRHFRAYTQANDTDPFGWYNLALAFEALDRYQAAADCYRKYLALYPNAPDRQQIEAKLVQLRQDRIDLLNYYAAVIESDLDYLKRFYQSIFNRSSADLAAEFNGFVNEKRDFYKNLADILEINERWLINDSKDLSDSFDTLADRAKQPIFDQDAVSLLTIPIGYLEELIEKLEKYRAQNLR